jgi:hypothetical protein
VGAGLAPPRPSRPTRPCLCPLPSQPPRPLGEFGSPRSRHGSGSYGPEPAEARSASQLEPDRRSLPRTPSACECPETRSAARGPGREEALGVGCSRRAAGQTAGRTSRPRAPALCAPQPRSTPAAPNALAPTRSASARPAAVAAPGESAPWSPTRRAPTTRCCASRRETSWRCWCPRPRMVGSTESWRARPRECFLDRFPSSTRHSASVSPPSHAGGGGGWGWALSPRGGSLMETPVPDRLPCAWPVCSCDGPEGRAGGRRPTAEMLPPCKHAQRTASNAPHGAGFDTSVEAAGARTPTGLQKC